MAIYGTCLRAVSAVAICVALTACEASTTEEAGLKPSNDGANVQLPGGCEFASDISFRALVSLAIGSYGYSIVKEDNDTQDRSKFYADLRQVSNVRTPSDLDGAATSMLLSAGARSGEMDECQLREAAASAWMMGLVNNKTLSLELKSSVSH